MFNKSLNINIPIFVDDGESIINIPKCDTQMLIAKVKNCDLTIKNNDEPVPEITEQVQANTSYIGAEQLSFNS